MGSGDGERLGELCGDGELLGLRGDWRGECWGESSEGSCEGMVDGHFWVKVGIVGRSEELVVVAVEY